MIASNTTTSTTRLSTGCGLRGRHQLHALALATCLLNGCATMIATSGVDRLSDIPRGVSRQEVQHRFGAPVASAVCADGTGVDIHSIRRKWANCPRPESCVREGLLLETIGAIGTFGISEILLLPTVLKKDHEERTPVAFLYGIDNRTVASPREAGANAAAATLCPAPDRSGVKQAEQSALPVE